MTPTPEPDYLTVNRANWDERAPAHATSPDYDLGRFRADPAVISDVVAFDRERLGDLAGVRGIHLQCHIGTDTLSLARLGATMTGLDFSAASLREARALAAGTGAAITYVESDVYAARAALEAAGEPAAYDLVYTGIGALCWLPSIERWADVAAGLVAPGGRLFLREGHPMLWSLDDAGFAEERLVVGYPYFETEEPQVWDEGGTYVQTDAEFATTVTHEWNHGLGEVIGALLARGLTVTTFVEHDSIPWEGLPGLMEPHPELPGELRLREHRERLPLSYTLIAERATPC